MNLEHAEAHEQIPEAKKGERRATEDVERRLPLQFAQEFLLAEGGNQEHGVVGSLHQNGRTYRRVRDSALGSRRSPSVCLIDQSLLNSGQDGIKDDGALQICRRSAQV